MSLHPQQRSVFIIVFIIFILVGCSLFSLSNEDASGIGELEDYFDTQIPESAIDLEYDYSIGRLHYIQLSFKAPPDDMEEFVTAIWDELLFQGYDPFNAINGEIIPGEVHLIISNFPYYSYSPDAPDTIWGGAYNLSFIRIDKTNPELYELRYEEFQSCIRGSVPPCLPVGRPNYINPIPTMPVMIIGINEIDGEYVLVSEEFCIETQLDYYSAIPSAFDYLLGASVDISIDGQHMARRYITEYFFLATESELDKALRGRYIFNDCFFEEWESGMHTMSVTITPIDGSPETYSWEFRVP